MTTRRRTAVKLHRLASLLAAGAILLGTAGCDTPARKTTREVKRYVAKGQLKTAYKETSRILKEAEENPGSWDEESLATVREIHRMTRQKLTEHFETNITAAMAKGDAQEVANYYGGVQADTPELLTENPSLQRRMMRFYGGYGVLEEAEAFASRLQQLPNATDEEKADAEAYLALIASLRQKQEEVEALRTAASEAIQKATGGEVFTPDLVQSCGINPEERLSETEARVLRQYQEAYSELQALQSRVRDSYNPTLATPEVASEEQPTQAPVTSGG
jgi:hypothetical protein